MLPTHHIQEKEKSQN